MILCILSVLMLFIINIYKLDDYINSDIVAEMKFAKEMWQQKTLFPEGWYSAIEPSNFRPSILTAILYIIFGNIMLAQSWTVNLVIIINIIAYYYMVRILNLDRSIKFLGLIYLLVGFTKSFTERYFTFFGYYGFVLAFIMLYTGYVIRVFENKKIKINAMFCIILICNIIFSVVGFRNLIFTCIPIWISSIIFEVIKRDKKIKDNKYSATIVTSIMILMNLLGLCLYKIIFVGNPYLPGNPTGMHIIKVTDLWKNLTNNISGIFKNLGIEGGMALFSLEGINTLIKYALLILVIILTYNIIFKKIICKEVTKEYICTIFVMGTIIALSVTSLTDVVNSGYAFWYFYSANLLWIIVLIFMIDKIQNRYKQISILSVIIVIAFNVYAVYIPMFKSIGNENEKKVGEYLEEENELIGYATFWKAGVIEALSNFKITIVSLDDNINENNVNNLQAYRWLTSENELLIPGNKKVVLVLDENEKNFIENNNPTLLLEAIKNKQVGDYYIYYYSKSPFYNRNILNNDSTKLKDYSAEVTVSSLKKEIRHNSEFECEVSMKNTSTNIWSNYARLDGKNGINLSYQWLDAESNEVVVDDGIRVDLGQEVLVGQSINKKITIKTPEVKGNYILRISLIQEGEKWFYEEGEGYIDNIIEIY